MPKAGTKKTVLEDGTIAFLPEEQAKLEQLVRRGLELQKILDGYGDELASIRDQVVELAEPHRGTRQSLRLTAPSAGVASITWSQETKVDATRALALREALGPELWGRLFREKVEVSLARGYQDAMRAPVGVVQRHAEDIAASLEVRPRKPSVKFEEPV